MDLLQVILIDIIVLVLSLAIIVGIMYFRNLKTVKQGQAKYVKLHEELKSGKKVMFANGLMGTLVSVKENTCEVEVAKGVVIEISRYCISEIVK